MKRDWNLVRDLMLAIEDQTKGGGHVLTRVGMPSSYTPEQVGAHLRMLDDAGYLDGSVSVYRGVKLSLALSGLTWSGHDFLDSIRDETVWEKTQEGAAKVGGSVALDTLKAIAAQISLKILGLE